MHHHVQFLPHLGGEGLGQENLQQGIAAGGGNANHPGGLHGQLVLLPGKNLYQHIAVIVAVQGAQGQAPLLVAGGEHALLVAVGAVTLGIVIDELRLVKLPTVRAVINHLINHLYRAQHGEGKIQLGMLRAEHHRIKGDALHGGIPAPAGIGRHIIGEQDEVILFRVDLGGGSAVVFQQIGGQLRQGNGAVVVDIGAIAALGADAVDQRAGEIPRAGQRAALGVPGPEPAFLRAAGGAQHLVIFPLKHIFKGRVHALAQHGAAAAGVNE